MPFPPARWPEPRARPQHCCSAQQQPCNQEGLQGAPRQPCPSPVGSVLPCTVSGGHPDLQHAAEPPAEKGGWAAWGCLASVQGHPGVLAGSSRLGWETLAGERGEGHSGCPGWGTGPAGESHSRTAPQHVRRKEGRRGCGLEMPSHEGVAFPMGNWGGAW